MSPEEKPTDEPAEKDAKAKPAAAKKPAAKSSAAEKPAQAKKPAAKKDAEKGAVAEEKPARARKAPAKKDEPSSAKGTPAEKPAAKDTSAEKPAAKKATASKAAAKKEPVAEKASDAKAEKAAVAKTEKPAPAKTEKPAGAARREGQRTSPARRKVVRAQARYVRTSARKARMVCGHLRGKSVPEARAILAFTPREVARDWSKLLESAVANAENNHELIEDDLFVREAYADEGPTIKRFRPRAQGRAAPIRKRTSHLTITLTPKP
jgi:ribosomal protein L22